MTNHLPTTTLATFPLSHLLEVTVFYIGIFLLVEVHVLVGMVTRTPEVKKMTLIAIIGIAFLVPLPLCVQWAHGTTIRGVNNGLISFGSIVLWELTLLQITRVISTHNARVANQAHSPTPYGG